MSGSPLYVIHWVSVGGRTVNHRLNLKASCKYSLWGWIKEFNARYLICKYLFPSTLICSRARYRLYWTLYGALEPVGCISTLARGWENVYLPSATYGTIKYDWYCSSIGMTFLITIPRIKIVESIGPEKSGMLLNSSNIHYKCTYCRDPDDRTLMHT